MNTNRTTAIAGVVAALHFMQFSPAIAFDLTKSLYEISRHVSDRKEESDVYVRCAGLYLGLYRYLEPLGLEKNQFSPYHRSSIILQHLAAAVRELSITPAISNDAPFSASSREEIMTVIKSEIEKTSNHYLLEIGNIPTSGPSVAKLGIIRNDLKICRQIAQELAPDVNRGTPGKLPK